MGFSDDLKVLATSVLQKMDVCINEEATKTAMIIPFFNLLGYDTTNPAEFLPEFTADVGTKKGEKVDYAILREGKPTILIECKWCGKNLDSYDAQLFRYFGTTTAKFGILTNGIEYRFYTDLESKNKMDLTPFMIFDLSNIKDSLVSKLQKFCKNNYNSSDIASTASTLKYSHLIQEWLDEQFDNPGECFQKLIINDVYAAPKGSEGKKNIVTSKVKSDFAPIIKATLSNFINERTNAMLQKAQTKDDPEVMIDEKPKIVTTEEELQGFFIVKSMLVGSVDISNVTYRDAETYFAIFYADNNRKPICHLCFGELQKSIEIPDENKKWTKHKISDQDELYKFKEDLVKVAKQYE